MQKPKNVCATSGLFSHELVNDLQHFTAEGHFEEAIKGYEKAKDYENLVRILVENLRRINEVRVSLY